MFSMTIPRRLSVPDTSTLMFQDAFIAQEKWFRCGGTNASPSQTVWRSTSNKTSQAFKAPAHSKRRNNWSPSHAKHAGRVAAVPGRSGDRNVKGKFPMVMRSTDGCPHTSGMHWVMDPEPYSRDPAAPRRWYPKGRSVLRERTLRSSIR